MVTTAIKLKDAAPGKESYGKTRQHIKKEIHHFADKGEICCYVQLFATHEL